MRTLCFVITILIGNINADAQTRPACWGDSTRAHLAWSAAHPVDPHVLTAYLGYINKDTATLQEAKDNIDIGIRASSPLYIVDSFEFGYYRPDTDYTGPNRYKGNKIPISFQGALHSTFITPKTRINFIVWMHRQGTEKAVKVAMKRIILK